VSESETGAERSVKRKRWAGTKYICYAAPRKLRACQLSPYEEPDAKREATTRRPTSRTSSHKRQRVHPVRHIPIRQATPDHRNAASPRGLIDLENAVKVLISYLRGAVRQRSYQRSYTLIFPLDPLFEIRIQKRAPRKRRPLRTANTQA
jgi:hypothetical protein